MKLVRSPIQIAFDNADVGSTSDPKLSTLTNNGADPVIVHAVESPTDFDVEAALPLPATIPPAGDLELAARFAPHSVGLKTEDELTHYVSENCSGLFNFNMTPPADPGWVDATATISDADFAFPHVTYWTESGSVGSITKVTNTRPGSASPYALRVAATGSAGFEGINATQLDRFESNKRYRLSGWYRTSNDTLVAGPTSGLIALAISARSSDWQYFSTDFWGSPAGFGAPSSGGKLSLYGSAIGDDPPTQWVEFSDLTLEVRAPMPIMANYSGPPNVVAPECIPYNDPSNWVDLIESPDAGNCAVEYAGAIYFGSQFGNIYKWDGAAWTDLGLIFSAPVESMVVFGGELIVTGLLETQRFNGATWTDMDHAYGQDLRVFAGDLYLGFAEGNGSGCVDRWDGGTTWTRVDIEPNYTKVFGMYADANYLYVPFSTGAIKIYDGFTWQDLGTCTFADDVPLSIIFFEGYIYVGTEYGAITSNREVTGSGVWGVQNTGFALGAAVRALYQRGDYLYVGSRMLVVRTTDGIEYEWAWYGLSDLEMGGAPNDIVTGGCSQFFEFQGDLWLTMRAPFFSFRLVEGTGQVGPGVIAPGHLARIVFAEEGAHYPPWEFNYGDAFTVNIHADLWRHPDLSLNQVPGIIGVFDLNLGAGWVAFILEGTNQVVFGIGDGPSGGIAVVTTAELTSGMHAVCFTVDGSNTAAGITVYFDGVAVATTVVNDGWTGPVVYGPDTVIWAGAIAPDLLFTSEAVAFKHISVYDEEKSAAWALDNNLDSTANPLALSLSGIAVSSATVPGSLTYGDFLKSLLPPGHLWALKMAGQFDEFLEGVGDESGEVLAFLGSLAKIRDPFETPLLADLETEYGIIPSVTTPELERRQNLAAVEYAAPGDGGPDYLQARLRAAGFLDLYVHQNDPKTDPNDYLGAEFFRMLANQTNAIAGNDLAFAGYANTFPGDLVVNGSLFTEVIQWVMMADGASSFAGNDQAFAGNFDGVERVPTIYEVPNDPDYWQFCFYVCGPNIGDIVQVPLERRDALRKIILQFKPMQSWGVLIVEYV